MPKTREKVVVAMSGGVDSSVAAALLCEQGYEVVGFFMRTGIGESAAPQAYDRHRGCCSASDAADARIVAGKLGVNFYALNFQSEFDSLIDYFADEYTRGRTPNPCVMCNNQLKFGRIFDYADSVGAHWVATGHYARMDHRPDQAVLQRAVDEVKDQTYVLFGLQRERLGRVLLPLGDLTKDEVREHARRLDLEVAEKPDSVDICFVPDRDYARVVKERRPDAFKPGEVFDQDGTPRGRHDGIGHFTIGQRRGLGIAVGLPIYVTRLDAADNSVTVGPKSALLSSALFADRANWLVAPMVSPRQVQAKIRYHHAAAPATVFDLGHGHLRVEFETPQSAIAPGQAVVFYDQRDCLGGAWIQSTAEPGQPLPS